MEPGCYGRYVLVLVVFKFVASRKGQMSPSPNYTLDGWVWKSLVPFVVAYSFNCALFSYPPPLAAFAKRECI